MFKGMRRILKIYWPNKVSNEEILKRVGSKRISEELKIRRWRWIGHVLRMDQGSHCSTALTWTRMAKDQEDDPRRPGEEQLRQNEKGWDG